MIFVPYQVKIFFFFEENFWIQLIGMSDVYQLWESLHHCLIHYVSAMPSQLYYVTQKFLDRENFPRGSFRKCLVLFFVLNLMKFYFEFRYASFKISSRRKTRINKTS